MNHSNVNRFNNFTRVKPVKTRQEIAREYGIAQVRTLNAWLKRKGVTVPKGNLCPKDQQMIYDTLGTPPLP